MKDQDIRTQELTIPYGGSAFMINNEFLVKTSGDWNVGLLFVVAGKGRRILFGENATSQNIPSDRFVDPEVGVVGVPVPLAELVVVGEHYNLRDVRTTNNGLNMTIETDRPDIQTLAIDRLEDHKEYLRRELRNALIGQEEH